MELTALNSQWSPKIFEIAKTNPIPENLKPPKVSGNICETCIKQDVCGLQGEFNKALHDIKEIKKRTNVFINVTVNCEHWHGNGSIFTTR